MIGPELAEERVRNILDSHYFTYVSIEKETIWKGDISEYKYPDKNQ